MLLSGMAPAGMAQGSFPAIPVAGAAAGTFVPEGWKLIARAEGDLNKDGAADLAIIIENTDLRHYKVHDGPGRDTLNLNPRMLLVLFRDKEAGLYRLAEKNTAFIPKPNDGERPCLADPLAETEKLTIRKGVLALHFQYWYSCGSWYTSNHHYLFRHQHGGFELIGFDCDEFHRATGERSRYSVNFSTGRYSHTTGENEFEDTGKMPETAWGTLKAPRRLALRQMDGRSFESIYKMIGIM